MERRTGAALCTGATTLAVAIGCGSPARTAAPPAVIVLNDNGAWSWFEDERAVIDTASGTLLVSSVANGHGTGGAARDGNVEVVAYDLATSDATRTVLHSNLQADDHNSAALHVRPDGRYMAAYSRHNSDHLTRWRISDGPGTAAEWGPEHTFAHEATTTYSNLVAVPRVGGDRLYNFVRSVGWDPNVLVSDDDGTTWVHGGRLLAGPGRPYVRYAAGGNGEIHLVASEQHPRDVATSIYHGVIDDGRLLRSDRTVADADVQDADAAAPGDLTIVFGGDAERRAWPIDLQINSGGLPYVAFSVRSTPARTQPGQPFEHRYLYGRFDGTSWHVHEMAMAGGELYAAEPDYTGLVALDPHDVSRVFISTDVDPVTAAPLISAADGRRHHELFEGVTIDGGATWSWTAVTADSTVDNIRPIVPTWDRTHRALLWLRGTYTSYTDYDLDVVGIVTELPGGAATSVAAGSARSLAGWPIPNPPSTARLTVLGSTVRTPIEHVEVFTAPAHVTEVRLSSDEVTSICPVTSQPDLSTVQIAYEPDQWCVETKSLKLYLWGFRQRPVFAEALAAEIAGEIMATAQPRRVTVVLTQRPRGGIVVSATAERSRS